ncbi:Ribosome biosis protein WDR12-like [Hondaea fermentalgiana]|uniref:Ribosome biogenesis protein WDR12 homolog n=1 Tax=Hondaea fermentalgiana TaxID=2315210 RepID=A0A2R5GAP8_9STRA|nr:Ribosome biosis protein WDR12-like [Hondaea fermentalgiana]|eukprot:GBG25623.1 Ribosome biosis protein WDR12-like [Hondaea fermentalgiana]
MDVDEGAAQEVEDDVEDDDVEEEEASEEEQGGAEEDEDEDDEDDEDDDDDDDDEEEGEGDEQIRVKFTTRFSKYRVTETSIAVPLSLRRAGLSEVVNHLLGREDEDRVVFDFLIVEKDTLVRRNLEYHLRTLKLSSEEVLHLEYAPALLEPELSAEEKWPDWLSCVDARRPTAENEDLVAVTGSYDGSLTFCEVARSSGAAGLAKGVTVLSKVQAHRAAVKGVTQFGENYVSSCGKDGVVKVWSTSLAEAAPVTRKAAANGSSSSTRSMNCTQIAGCEGHERSVEALDAVQIGNFAVMGSGGWDQSVCIWKVALGNEDDVTAAKEEGEDEGDAANGSDRKKRKVKGAKAASALKTVKPASVLSGHTDSVSALTWADRGSPSTLFSGSWDRSIRAWDVVREVCTIKLNGNKVVTAIAHNPTTATIATGHADEQVRLWDSRVTGEAIVKLSLKSHEAWITSVQWSPSRPHLLASASQDQTIKLWDVRSSVPLHTLKSHTNKVFGLSWDASGTMLMSAGADSMLRAYRVGTEKSD